MKMQWLRKAASSIGRGSRKSSGSERLDKEVDATFGAALCVEDGQSRSHSFSPLHNAFCANPSAKQSHKAEHEATTRSNESQSRTSDSLADTRATASSVAEVSDSEGGGVCAVGGGNDVASVEGTFQEVPTENGEMMYVKCTLPKHWIEYIDTTIEPLTKEACGLIMKLADEGIEDGWILQTDKTTKVFKKFIKGQPMIGKSVIDFEKALDLDIRSILFYLWDTNTKGEFDPYMDRNIKLLQWDMDNAAFYQSFKGRFGVAGRYFVLGSHRLIQGHFERAAIGVASIEWKDAEERDEFASQYSKGYVRGHAPLAGFDLSYRPNGDIRLTYINQADLKSSGIPDWITNRVKLDQLCVLEDLKKNVIRLHQAGKLPRA